MDEQIKEKPLQIDSADKYAMISNTIQFAVLAIIIYQIIHYIRNPSKNMKVK